MYRSVAVLYIKTNTSHAHMFQSTIKHDTDAMSLREIIANHGTCTLSSKTCAHGIISLISYSHWRPPTFGRVAYKDTIDQKRRFKCISDVIFFYNKCALTFTGFGRVVYIKTRYIEVVVSIAFLDVTSFDNKCALAFTCFGQDAYKTQDIEDVVASAFPNLFLTISARWRSLALAIMHIKAVYRRHRCKFISVFLQ